jgi:sec-independent protein translocase protein TatC
VPVVVVVLVRFGVVSLEKLRDFRPYAIVAAFVIAAVVTPPDVTSQFMLALPMCLLYELGLFVARFVGKRQAPMPGESDYQAPTDAEMERELDKADGKS